MAYSDHAMASEIAGYTNTYLQRRVDSAKANLAKKKASGKYSAAKAPKLMRYIVDAAAKEYFKEYYRDSPQSAWSREINIPTRNEAAKMLVDDFQDEWVSGALDEYIPKKYRDSPSVRTKNPRSIRTKSTPWIPVKAIRFRDGKLDLRVSKAVKRSIVGGARLGNPGKKRYRYTGAVEIVWSPVNQAWFVLWGRGSIETRQVLKVFNDLSDARYYARVDLGAKPLSKGSK